MKTLCLNKKAQNLVELAAFSSFFILMLSYCVRFGLDFNYQQDTEMQSFRRGLVNAYEYRDHTLAPQFLYLKDKETPDPRNLYGGIETVDYGAIENLAWSNKLFMSLNYNKDDELYGEALPRLVYRINDKEYTYTVGRYSYIPIEGLPYEEKIDSVSGQRMKFYKAKRIKSDYKDKYYLVDSDGGGEIDSSEECSEREYGNCDDVHWYWKIIELKEILKTQETIMGEEAFEDLEMFKRIQGLAQKMVDVDNDNKEEFVINVRILVTGYKVDDSDGSLTYKEAETNINAVDDYLNSWKDVTVRVIGFRVIDYQGGQIDLSITPDEVQRLKEKAEKEGWLPEEINEIKIQGPQPDMDTTQNFNTSITRYLSTGGEYKESFSRSAEARRKFKIRLNPNFPWEEHYDPDITIRQVGSIKIVEQEIEDVFQTNYNVFPEHSEVDK